MLQEWLHRLFPFLVVVSLSFPLSFLLVVLVVCSVQFSFASLIVCFVDGVVLCVHRVVVVVVVGTPRAHLVEFMLPARAWICGQGLLPGHVTQKEAPLNAGRHF